MLRFGLSVLMLTTLLLTACASVGAAPATDTPLPPAATPLPTSLPDASPTPMPSPSDDVISNDQTPPPGGLPDYAPQPGDSALVRGNAFVEESGLLQLESFPPPYQLSLSGALPTPCHQLRVAVAPPDAKHQILVDVYTVVNPNLACIQVLASFTANIPLNGYPVGPTYTVLVNGAVVGEFTPQAP